MMIDTTVPVIVLSSVHKRFIKKPPYLPMHNIWKEGPICLFNGVIDKRRYYAHRHAILALRGDEIEPFN